MATYHRALLANIKRFDQLIAYLRDEMAWPITGSDFDELTFEYTPEELGIDVVNAAKIQEIKRLRPLAPNQPWGIFFVKFEPKQLPVVALRRILGQVVVKKRAATNSSERRAWAAEDLLFVSNYGQGATRQISFAHFATPKESRDLPTLKVLGWENRDTALHLDAVAEGLTQHLSWPDDEDNADAWREQWRAAFTLRHREVITTSRDLSIRLATLARAIRNRIQTTLAIETEDGRITKLMKAFKEALVHDLNADSFADMYAQTIAYGLLSARIADPHKRTVDDFAGHMRTNPFLRDLMETFLQAGESQPKTDGSGIDFDELGISDVVELLDDAKMEAVIRDFGDRNPREDPIIHFYELFLKEYDPKKRTQRGVFYTPLPVVSYIVRSVDTLLRTEFGLADGLADTTTWDQMARRHANLEIPQGISPEQDFVQVLDPATGTGTFLVEVIDTIHRTLVEKWRKQGRLVSDREALWNEYVPKHLLPRLHGYELLMAPYAIAHLKISLKLYETGYRFGSEERAQVYLTNALEPAHDSSGLMEFAIPALAHEAQAVNQVKDRQRFTVVIGNPPYSGHSANKSEWIRDLLGGSAGDGPVENYFEVDGGPLNERNPKWLNDDYVKFIRLAHWQIGRTGRGVVGFITNHSYLDNPTFRGMRESLTTTFPLTFLLDLHGNARKKERAPDGGKDENVFDIQQGVAIGLFVKPTQTDLRPCNHTDLWGSRERTDTNVGKYSWLVGNDAASTEWQALYPKLPLRLFVPRDEALHKEYEAGWSLTDIFPVNSVGIVTARDKLAIPMDGRRHGAHRRGLRRPRDGGCTVVLRPGQGRAGLESRVGAVSRTLRCAGRVCSPIGLEHRSSSLSFTRSSGSERFASFSSTVPRVAWFQAGLLSYRFQWSIENLNPPHHDALRVHARALLVAFVHPGELPFVELRLIFDRGDRVVQDRALGAPCEPLQEVVVLIPEGVAGANRISARGLGDLDEALVPLAQHVGQNQDVLVDHLVGGHRRAVVVGLERVLAEALNREAARAGVDRLVQKPLHLQLLRLGGRTVLRRLEPHHVHHEG